MITHGKGIKIFSGNSSKKLASIIASMVGVPLGNAEVSRFSDGEVKVDIFESVRGSDVFVVQSTSEPVNDHLMEMLLMIDALKRASAGRITAVIPYFGYARQDRKAKARDPISAKLVADLITAAGADRILTIDLHVAQIQGFFNIPVDHLLGIPPILVPYYAKKFEDTSDVVVVSPDLGSVGRVRSFAQRMDCPMAIIDKRRPKANVSEVMNIIGEVSGKKLIIVDDLIDTAGTIVNGTQALYENGAKEIYVCCTHGIFSAEAIERISDSDIKELVVLDTVDLPSEKRIPKIKVLSVAPVLSEAIKRIYEDLSVSALFS